MDPAKPDHRTTVDTLDAWDEVVRVGDEDFRILVYSPNVDIVLGAERLAAIRSGDQSSELDSTMVDIARSWPSRIDAAVFLGSSLGRRWGFDENLSAEDLEDLARAMVRAQLRLYQGLVSASVHSLTGIQMMPRDHFALRRATEQVAAETEAALRTAGVAQRAVVRFDLWLLDHFALWTTSSREEFFAEQLPNVLAVVCRRRAHFERMNLDITESGAFTIGS